MGRTTISVSEETHRLLDGYRNDGETWDGCCRRLLAEARGPGEADATEVIARIEELDRTLPDRVAERLFEELGPR